MHTPIDRFFFFVTCITTQTHIRSSFLRTDVASQGQIVLTLIMHPQGTDEELFMKQILKYVYSWNMVFLLTPHEHGHTLSQSQGLRQNPPASLPPLPPSASTL